MFTTTTLSILFQITENKCRKKQKKKKTQRAMNHCRNKTTLDKSIDFGQRTAKWNAVCKQIKMT